jgi:hypothetical protein
MGDLLSAASLLLTVVGVIYSLWYQEISQAIDSAPQLPPPDHREDRAEPRKKLRAVLRTKALPLSVASICIALVFLPPSVALVFQFVHEYHQVGFSIFLKYDAITVSFILVELFSLSFAYLSSVRAWKLNHLTRN